MEKPKPFWKRELRADFKRLFASLGKAALAAGVAAVTNNPRSWAGVASAGIDVISSLGFSGSTLENRIYLLFLRALNRALCELLEENRRSLNAITDAEVIAEKMTNTLAETELVLDLDFFERPGDLPFFKDFEAPLANWLEDLGIEQAAARTVAGRLSTYFAAALHDEWRSAPQEYEIIKTSMESPFIRADEREKEWRNYLTLLQKQVQEPVFGEPFSLSQIFIPMRAYYEEEKRKGSKGLKSIELDFLKRKEIIKHVAYLDDELRKWWHAADEEDTFRFISGEPGSGKSSCVRMFAAKMAAEGVNVLLIPLHRIDPGKNLVQAAGEYILNGGHFQKNPFLAGERPERMLVIFDGLDELAGQGRLAEELARKFVEEILRTANTINEQGAHMSVLISGRILVIQGIRDIVRNTRQIIHLLRYFVHKVEHSQYQDPGELLKIDQRNNWWNRLSLIRGLNYDGMPPELSKGRLGEITSQPLLNYLVSLNYEKGKLNFEDVQNLNSVYYDLLEAVYKRGWSDGPSPGVGRLDFASFVRILEEIGLAAFHGDGRKASQSDILEQISSPALQNMMSSFEADKGGVIQLLLSFFFRQGGVREGEKTFEFTHKSFGEYLAARRMVHGLLLIHGELLSYYDNPKSGSNEIHSLEDWVHLAGPSSLTHHVLEFIRDEITLLDEEVILSLQSTLSRLLEIMLQNGMPMHLDTEATYGEMRREARNAEEVLLVALNACARASKNISRVNWPRPTSFSTWYSRLQPQRWSVKFTVTHLCLSYLDLSGQILPAKNLAKCDLSYTQLVGSNLEGVNLSGANLEGANMLGTNLMGANLFCANLKEATLEGALLCKVNISNVHFFGIEHRSVDMTGANFINANLLGANLADVFAPGASLPNANLADTTLTRANLDGADLTNANLSGADLSDGNLMGADLDNANFTGVLLQGARIDARWKDVLQGFEGDPEWGEE